MNATTERDVLTLGSGKLIAHRIGPRASHLDRARVNKLPVPPGVIILEELIKECYSSYGSSLRGKPKSTEQNVRLVREDFLRDRLLTALPLLFSDIHWKKNLSENDGRIKLAIRPAFSFDDGENEPPPAMFHTELNVDSSSAILVLESIKSVLASAHNYQNVKYAEELAQNPGSAIKGHNLRRDVMIMPMVNARHSGLAFLQHDYEDDVIQFMEGHALDLTQGKTKGSRILLPRIRGLEKPGNSFQHEFLPRLQKMIKKVRTVFGDSRDLEIEWADDGKQVWLLQIRYLTRDVKRYEVMSSLLHKEFFPGKASQLTADLFEECARKAFAFLRVLDSSMPSRRVFVKNINNQICVNVSLLYDVSRILGLPTRIVEDYLVPHALKEDHQRIRLFPINYLRILFRLPVFWKVYKSRLGLSGSLDKLMQTGSSPHIAPLDVKSILQQFIRIFSDGFRLVLLSQFALVLPTRLLNRFGILDVTLQRRRSIFKNILGTIAKNEATNQKVENKLIQDLKYFLVPVWDLAREGRAEYSTPLNVHTLDLRYQNRKLPNLKMKLLYFVLQPVRFVLGSVLKQRERLFLFLQYQMDNFYQEIEAMQAPGPGLWSSQLDAIFDRQIPKKDALADVLDQNTLPILFRYDSSTDSIQSMKGEAETTSQIRAFYISDVNKEFTSIDAIYQEKGAEPDQLAGIQQPSITEWSNIPVNRAVLIDKIARFSKSSFQLRSLGFHVINISDLSLLVNLQRYKMDSPEGPLVSTTPPKKKKAGRLAASQPGLQANGLPARKVNSKKKSRKQSPTRAPDQNPT